MQPIMPVCYDLSMDKLLGLTFFRFMVYFTRFLSLKSAARMVNFKLPSCWFRESDSSIDSDLTCTGVV